ncbi:hypothetical protein IWQ60_004219 [Tieghemiomyces parasiticus]|uniref:Uncharacterized protein n=1 Tax=Tieghemiomyces parasiticus TaxID=78921 RepID=A0A9W8DVQ7_9FUNG|nr:hypothetical protein IWQ60_004219 [Tieghemiomyces parasiticus]
MTTTAFSVGAFPEMTAEQRQLLTSLPALIAPPVPGQVHAFYGDTHNARLHLPSLGLPRSPHQPSATQTAVTAEQSSAGDTATPTLNLPNSQHSLGPADGVGRDLFPTPIPTPARLRPLAVIAARGTPRLAEADTDTLAAQRFVPTVTRLCQVAETGDLAAVQECLAHAAAARRKAQTEGSQDYAKSSPAEPADSLPTSTTGVLSGATGTAASTVAVVEEEVAADSAMPSTGMTALHYAAKRGHLEVVQWLVDVARAPVDQCDRENETALLKAAYQGQLAVAKFLLQRGANARHTDKDGWTALHNASSRGHVKLVRWLLEKAPGVAVDAQNHQGYTPLMNAAALGHILAVKYLLFRAQANPLIQSHAGESAYDVAAATVTGPGGSTYLCDILAATERQWRQRIRASGGSVSPRPATSSSPLSPADTTVPPALPSRAADLYLAYCAPGQLHDLLVYHHTVVVQLFEHQRSGTSSSFGTLLRRPFGNPKFTVEQLHRTDPYVAPAALADGTPCNRAYVRLPPTLLLPGTSPHPLVLGGDLRRPFLAETDGDATNGAYPAHETTSDWFWLTDWSLDTTHPQVNPDDGWQYARAFYLPDAYWIPEPKAVLLNALPPTDLVDSSVARQAFPWTLPEGTILPPVTNNSWVRRRRWVRVMKRKVDLAQMLATPHTHHEGATNGGGANGGWTGFYGSPGGDSTSNRGNGGSAPAGSSPSGPSQRLTNYSLHSPVSSPHFGLAPASGSSSRRSSSTQLNLDYIARAQALLQSPPGSVTSPRATSPALVPRPPPFHRSQSLNPALSSTARRTSLGTELLLSGISEHPAETVPGPHRGPTSQSPPPPRDDKGKRPDYSHSDDSGVDLEPPFGARYPNPAPLRRSHTTQAPWRDRQGSEELPLTLGSGLPIGRRLSTQSLSQLRALSRAQPDGPQSADVLQDTLHTLQASITVLERGISQDTTEPRRRLAAQILGEYRAYANDLRHRLSRSEQALADGIQGALNESLVVDEFPEAAVAALAPLRSSFGGEGSRSASAVPPGTGIKGHGETDHSQLSSGHSTPRRIAGDASLRTLRRLIEPHLISNPVQHQGLPARANHGACDGCWTTDTACGEEGLGRPATIENSYRLAAWHRLQSYNTDAPTPCGGRTDQQFRRIEMALQRSAPEAAPTTETEPEITQGLHDLTIGEFLASPDATPELNVTSATTPNPAAQSALAVQTIPGPAGYAPPMGTSGGTDARQALSRYCLPEHAWEPDAAAVSCRLCDRRFSFFFRRHHCRRCGLVVCDPCSATNNWLVRPEWWEPRNTPSGAEMPVSDHQPRHSVGPASSAGGNDCATSDSSVAPAVTADTVADSIPPPPPAIVTPSQGGESLPSTTERPPPYSPAPSPLVFPPEAYTLSRVCDRCQDDLHQAPLYQLVGPGLWPPSITSDTAAMYNVLGPALPISLAGLPATMTSYPAAGEFRPAGNNGSLRSPGPSSLLAFLTGSPSSAGPMERAFSSGSVPTYSSPHGHHHSSPPPPEHRQRRRHSRSGGHRSRRSLYQATPHNASDSSLMHECPVCGIRLDRVSPHKAIQERHVQDCLESTSPPVQPVVRYLAYRLEEPGGASDGGSGAHTSTDSAAPSAPPTPGMERPLSAVEPTVVPGTDQLPTPAAINMPPAPQTTSANTLVGQECLICFEEFEPGQVVARLNCLCTYHRTCIDTWLRRSGHCPIHYE